MDYYYTYCFIFGLLFNHFANFIGLLSGEEAVLYYAEIHENYFNELIHRTTIPIASYYFLNSVPQLLGLNYDNSTKLRGGLYTVLLTHYAKDISIYDSINVGMIYIPILLLVNFNHNRNGGTKHYALYNLLRASMIMVFAETIGHTCFEGTQSRPEGVLNAILFSPYFVANGIV